MTAEKILTIPPDTNGGWPGNYNWFGANKVEIIGRYTSGNKDTNNLSNQKVFKHISDSDWMTDIPKYNIGQQDNNHAKKDIYYVSACDCGSYVRDNVGDYTKGKAKSTPHGKPRHNNIDDLKWIFREGGAHQRGFISDWNGHYGAESSKWYQTNGFSIYNKDKTEVYPFAVKGVSFTIRVPNGKDGLDAWGFVDQHGKFCTINYMHGLWMDENKKFYSYELMPNGDNWGKAKVSDLREPYWTGDPAFTNYYFLRDSGKGKSKFRRKYFPDNNQAVKIRAFTTAAEVEHLYFVGFSCLIKTHNDGTENKAHTIQFSNLAPIPFFSPRPPTPFKGQFVMGAPTPLDKIKEGSAKIHYDGGRATGTGFTTSGTDYHPQNFAPGYGPDDVFPEIPPEFLPQPEQGDEAVIPDVETDQLNTDIISDDVVVSGMSGIVQVTSSSPYSKLSLKDEPFVDGAEGIFAANDEKFRVKMTSPSQMGQSRNTEITVGGNEPVEWTIFTTSDDDTIVGGGPEDTTPDPWNWEWNAQNDVVPDYSTGPPAVQITGITEDEGNPVPVVISCDAEKYQVRITRNQTASISTWVDNPTNMTIVNDQWIRARLTSSSLSAVTKTMTITIGDGDPVSFSVTTKQFE